MTPPRTAALLCLLSACDPPPQFASPPVYAGGEVATTTPQGSSTAEGVSPQATDARVPIGPEAALAATAEPSAAPSAAPVSRTEDMLPVPGGRFTMGSDSGGERDEQPAHEVTVEPFLLDRTEVTNAAYRDCVREGACSPWRDDVAQSFGAGPDERFREPDQPVVGVSWFDAERYCRFRGKRLPTEAEWERAARGDDARRYPWGNTAPEANLHGAFGRKPGPRGGKTASVGSFPAGAGPFGHLDLAGNVWEWLADPYDPFAYRREGAGRGVPGSCEEILKTQDELRKQGTHGFTGTNPIPTVCERVLRGGAFNYFVAGLRATNRVHHPPDWRMLVAGIRCARSAS